MEPFLLSIETHSIRTVHQGVSSSNANLQTRLNLYHVEIVCNDSKGGKRALYLIVKTVFDL